MIKSVTDIDSINAKLSRIVGEAIDVHVSDGKVQPTLIESIRQDIPDVWKKVQAIERGEKQGVSGRVLKEDYQDNDKGMNDPGHKPNRYRDEDDFIDSMGGDKQDLIDYVKDSEDVEEFVSKLPYKADPDCMIVRGFYHKYSKPNAEEACNLKIKEEEEIEEVVDANEYFLIRGPMSTKIIPWANEKAVRDIVSQMPKKAKIKISLVNNAHGDERDIYSGMPEGYLEGLGQTEAKLTYKQREKLAPGEFVFKKERKYPIHDLAHGRAALARVSQHGTPEEQKKVRAAVYSKFPSLKESEFEELEASNGWKSFNEAFTEWMSKQSKLQQEQDDDDESEYIKDVTNMREPFLVAELREVASNWHGGQFTALYKFASTGGIEPGLAKEAEEAAKEAEAMPDREDDVSALRTIASLEKAKKRN